MTTTTGRHRLATRAAVAGAAAFLGLIALPVLAADFDDTVRYNCSSTTYPLQVTLDGPAANPTPSQVVTVTWAMAPDAPSSPAEGGAPTESLLTAPVDISPSDAVVIEGKATITGLPLGATTISASPSATESAVALLTASATMSLIPDMVLVFTPTATGTVAVAAGGFVLKIIPSGGGSTSTPYTCELANPASLATLTIAVVTSAATSESDDPTTTTTQTAFETETVTATATETETETVTNSVDTTNTVSVTNTRQIGITPVGGAQTGGGGDLGPDARLIMMAGTALIGAAAIGGLVLRHRLGRRLSLHANRGTDT
ncbi:hypothetical protein Aph01nite_37880 [Acrocarpospora phusangensis]|uniref:Uncharacterized protein n=1 Tax=Acrocarpospora phusangensis TaxID=1070424 RepID=A0A919QB92_9ACTN|nr:hypothetical protein [Acrocarpospora phusangensis]GIH25478.1 hypothetical protein Aph01nite_37880 [Acrocarpospora phusangensis]